MSLTVRDLRKLLAPTHRRIMHMVSRAKLNVVDDDQGLQRNQVSALDGETRDGVERFQQYGFSSYPPAGAEALMLSMGGSRDHPVIVAVDDRRSRPRGGKPGEVEIYNGHGISLRLIDDGTLLIKAPLKVRIETPVLEVTGEIIDRAETNQRTLGELRDTYNGHRHPNTVDPVDKVI